MKYLLRTVLLLLVVAAIGCDKAAPPPPIDASQEKTGANRK